jgi:hypothetical protein
VVATQATTTPKPTQSDRQRRQFALKFPWSLSSLVHTLFFR